MKQVLADGTVYCIQSIGDEEGVAARVRRILHHNSLKHYLEPTFKERKIDKSSVGQLPIANYEDLDTTYFNVGVPEPNVLNEMLLEHNENYDQEVGNQLNRTEEPENEMRSFKNNRNLKLKHWKVRVNKIKLLLKQKVH